MIGHLGIYRLWGGGGMEGEERGVDEGWDLGKGKVIKEQCLKMVSIGC